MTRYLPLLWANLLRKRLRTVLTIASITVAFLLFGLLEALRFGLTGNVELASHDRLITLNKASIIQTMPRSYLARIRDLEGVRSASSQVWFGGIYQDDRNQLAVMAADASSLFDVYPEFRLDEDAKFAWIADRAGALVGRGLADRYGWKVGDTIPMRSRVYTRDDGGNVWPLTVDAIYDTDDANTSVMFVHYDYLNASRAVDKDSIGWVMVRLHDGSRAAELAARIDAMFANSPTETKTSTERAFAQGFANQLGNVGAIITAMVSIVFFTMLLITANTIGHAVRERMNEIALMKALGFSSAGVTSLVIVEAVAVTAAGGLVGLLFAGRITQGVAAELKDFMPLMMVPSSAYVTGVLMVVLLGAAAAALPSIQAWQLRIAPTLRRG